MEKLLNDYKISFTKGDTYALAVKFKNITQDLGSAYFTVKENPEDTPLIQKSLGAGISKIDDRAYKDEKTYKIQLQSEDTANLEPLVQYLYDFRVAVGNVVQTILSGVFVVRHNISNVSTTDTSTLTVEIADTLESDLETTPATQGIEYENDPVAMAKIGDMTKLLTTNKASIVSAINEIKNGVSVNKTEIDNIKDGRTIVPKAMNATSADSATSASTATKATQDANGDKIDETYLKKTDTVNKAKNAEKVNNLEITVDENGVLGYLSKIVVAIGGDTSSDAGMSEYELFCDGNLQIGQKLYYNNEETEVVQFIEDEDFSIGGYYIIFCSSTGAFASASGTTITVALSNQRAIIPQKKLIWSGATHINMNEYATVYSGDEELLNRTFEIEYRTGSASESFDYGHGFIKVNAGASSCGFLYPTTITESLDVYGAKIIISNNSAMGYTTKDIVIKALGSALNILKIYEIIE